MKGTGEPEQDFVQGRGVASEAGGCISCISPPHRGWGMGSGEAVLIQKLLSTSIRSSIQRGLDSEGNEFSSENLKAAWLHGILV